MSGMSDAALLAMWDQTGAALRNLRDSLEEAERTLHQLLAGMAEPEIAVQPISGQGESMAAGCGGSEREPARRLHPSTFVDGRGASPGTPT